MPEEMPSDVIVQLEMDAKYEGYIKRQKEQIEKFKKLEDLVIPESFSYENIPGSFKRDCTKALDMSVRTLLVRQAEYPV